MAHLIAAKQTQEMSSVCLGRIDLFQNRLGSSFPEKRKRALPRHANGAAEAPTEPGEEKSQCMVVYSPFCCGYGFFRHVNMAKAYASPIARPNQSRTGWRGTVMRRKIGFRVERKQIGVELDTVFGLAGVNKKLNPKLCRRQSSDRIIGAP